MADRLRRKHLQQKQAETDKLLETRKSQLESLEKDHAKQIKPIENSISELKDKLKDLSGSKLALEGDLTALDSEITSKRDVLSTLISDIESSKGELDNLRAKQTGVQTAVTSLGEQKTKLESHNAELVDKNNQLVQKNRKLIDDTRLNQEKFETQNTENLHTINNQRAEIRANEDRKIQDEKTQEIIRADLAARTRAVEEREKNVKIREYKTDRDQAMISRNSDLLSL